MATSYTSLLGLALPVTGELSGTWGDTVNNYISNYIDAAVAGAQTVTADTTLTKTTGASLSGTSSQYAIIIASPASANITITAPAASKIYTIINTSATYTVKIVGAGPTTGITLNASEKAQVAWNGSDFVRVGSTSVFGSPSASMTLDTSGNLGIGVTPSAWNQSGYKALEIGVIGNGINSGLNDISVFANVYYNTTLKYATSGYAASYYVQNSGAHKWFNAPSGTAGNTITFTQAMTLDASGNLLVGGTTQFGAAKLTITSGGAYIALNSTTGGYSLVRGFDSGTERWAIGQVAFGGADGMAFYTGSSTTERMRLDSSGNLGLGVTPSAWASGQGAMQFKSGGLSAWSNGGFNGYLYSNAYYDGSTNRYINNGFANSYAINNSSGIHAWFTAPSGTAGNAITFTQAMTLDSSGNLGLGVTPSAWATVSPVMQLPNGNYIGSQGSVDTFYVGQNHFYNGTNFKYVINGYATQYQLGNNNGSHQWKIAGSGTAGNNISFTTAMTLDASGNLGLGVTPSVPFQINKNGVDTTAGWFSISKIQDGSANKGLDIGYLSGSQTTALVASTNSAASNMSFWTYSGSAWGERMRLDSSGNLGIGTSSPFNVANQTCVTVNGTNVGRIELWSGGTSRGYFAGLSGEMRLAASSTNPLTFETNGTEKMRLDSSGNLLLNTTTLTSASISVSNTLQVNSEALGRGSNCGWFWENQSGGVTSSTNWYGWYTTGGTIYVWNGGSNIASINSGTGAYTALSDRNKKKDFEPSAIGLNEVMRLKPTLFRMLDDADDSAKKLGFIAQDVADVIPQAYVEHRALDAVGKDSVYIGLNDRPFIAALTKAIQEQQAMIQSLTDRISQLEAK